MSPVLTGKFNDDELWYAFKKFDLDNSGEITVEELSQILSKVGQFYSNQQIADMIKTVDRDNNGKLNFEGTFLSPSKISNISFYILKST